VAAPQRFEFALLVPAYLSVCWCAFKYCLASLLTPIVAQKYSPPLDLRGWAFTCLAILFNDPRDDLARRWHLKKTDKNASCSLLPRNNIDRSAFFCTACGRRRRKDIDGSDTP